MLEEHRVDYMIVGGYAVAFHGFPRFTKDIDIFFADDRDNVGRLHAALVSFGFQAATVAIETLETPDSVFSIGLEPVRIDLLNRIAGVTFEEARGNAIAAARAPAPNTAAAPPNLGQRANAPKFTALLRSLAGGTGRQTARRRWPRPRPRGRHGARRSCDANTEHGVDVTMDERQLLERIVSDPQIFGGKPVIRGRRLAVEHLLGMLAAGDDASSILAHYPWLEADDVRACLVFARRLVGHGRWEPFPIASAT